MKASSLAALAALSVVLATSVSAATPDCFGGYKTFISKVAPYINKVEDADLATLMRRGLSVYDACQAGDTFTAHGIWDQIAADMVKRFKK
jgi:hypothetical protein